MIASMDTHYAENKSTTAVVLFENWSDTNSLEFFYELEGKPADYIPGKFYLRELPCLLSALSKIEAKVDVIVIDGYVQLGRQRPGLGMKLFESLNERTPVIGVAKNPFSGTDSAIGILRGDSKRPLFVTAVGIDTFEAASCIESMYGKHRIPTLLKHTDRLARRN